jgi:hypothetical protein
VALVLSAVKFKSNPELNLLPEPVIVAQVLATPTVEENDLVLYMSASNELRINGTGFIGAKKVDLYFQPPLTKAVAYEDVSPYPLSRNQVVLRLRHGYQWREGAGPLSVIGVDTGGGPVKTNGDEGVQVASILTDDIIGTVSVATTASTQLIYDDEPTIIISGSGFNPVGNVLRFSNGLLGNNVNYTTISTTGITLTLRLVPGSHWRKSIESLPGTLNIVAINTGFGFIAVNLPSSGKGSEVATVFERPAVYSNNVKIFRTHAHELHIQGTGFPDLVSGFKPQFRFSPALTEGLDYTVRVVSRVEVELTLLDGMAWRADAGPLQVTHVNTRGDSAGWVAMPGMNGVHVAEVVDDVDAVTTGGVEIFPMGVKVYQSALQEQIEITGTGFHEGMSLTLDPPLARNVDYELEVVSKNKVMLYLKNGKKWRREPGLIVAKKVNLGGKEYALAGSEGIRIAVVLADPVITPSRENLHETQSKLLVISGSGFTDLADVKVTVRPTATDCYKVIGVTADTIRVQLRPDREWLPSFLTLRDEASSRTIPLQVASIDTGAGEVFFDTPITVGYITKDREGVVCDDSCEFAFDGVCDEGALSRSSYYGEVSACVAGTDCTDCGGVDSIKAAGDCTNDCVYASDGVCDDPRGFGYCALGTDCDDCGPVSAGNHTVRSIIRDTSATQRVYSDQGVVFLAATVLHPTGSAFRWSNKMRGDGVDYDVDLVDHTTLALRRSDGFEWERRFYQLPTVLYLEAVNDGMGADKFRTLPGHGVGVATVFPRPSILPGALKLFRTASSELHLQGAGFPPPGSGFGVSLQFSPALRLDHDYTVRVVSHTDLFIQLSAGASWRAQPGALMVTGVNTAGGDENWVWFAGEGVRVADVHWDPDESNWSRQMLTAGAVVLVLVLCGMCFWRSGRGGTATTAQPAPVEVRYQKVASSERDLEMTARGASSAGGMLSMVPASEVIVCADVEEANEEDDNGGVDGGDPIREAVYSDQRQEQVTAYEPPALDSAA